MLSDVINDICLACGHFFDRDEPDWGFTSFMKLQDITKEGSGFLEDDTLVVKVFAKVTPHKQDNEFDPDEQIVISRVCVSQSLEYI